MSTQTDEKTRVPLSPEDRARMARLYEEIEGRLHEMALIAARTLSGHGRDGCALSGTATWPGSAAERGGSE